MRQDFSGVTDKELAQLFPILLVSYNDNWRRNYARQKLYLQSLLGDDIARISHIGSTAVPGLLSKPTIDILLEVADRTDVVSLTEQMLNDGYVVNTPPGDIVMLLKGYTPRGFEGQAVHIHVRHNGDWDEPYFRDYLLARPDVAAQYAALKTNLAVRFRYDRDGYTAAKRDFVSAHTARARKEYPNRYIPVV